MADNVSDVFRFVAVRPVQLGDEDGVAIGVIRDARTDEPRGEGALRTGLTEFGSPRAALVRWGAVDLGPYLPLAAARRQLDTAYARLRPTDDVPAPWDVPGLADVRGVDPGDARVLGALWDAVYVAHATGSGAGTRLDVPTAALRTLHLLALAAAGHPFDRVTARRALRARVAIAPSLDAVLRPRRRGATGVDATETDVHHDAAGPDAPSDTRLEERLAAARAVVSELQTAEALRRRLTGPAATARPVLTRSTVTTVGSFSGQQVGVQVGGTLAAVLGGPLDADTTAALDAAGVTPTDGVPAAVAKLDDRLAALTTRAATSVADPAVRRALLDHVDVAHPGDAELFGSPPPEPATTPVTDPGTAADVDVHGRITPLGIGDLKVVKQTLLAYEPGEVAYIENVLTGESRQRVVRALQRSQTTLLTSTEQTQATERDTTTTDRFELKREADSTIKEDLSVKAGLQVTASYGPIVARATGDFAYSTSSEDSQKTSSDFAHDVVDRSVTKVELRTTTTRTTTTLDENEQTDTHGIDNSRGAEHVVGIYRWVDKRYRAQVHNYGRRLLLEFVVPEPAAFYRAATAGLPVAVDATAPHPLVDDLTFVWPPAAPGPLTAADLDPHNYQQYAARYGAAGVTPPPPEWKYVSAALSKDALDDGKSIAVTSKDFLVPDGYTLHSYDIAASVLWINHPKLTVQVSDQIFTVIDHEDGGNSALTTWPHTAAGDTSPGSITPVSGQVPVSVAGYDVHAFTLNVQGLCSRDPATYTTWQLQTYDKVVAAYQALQTVYDQKVAAAHQAARDAHVVGQNPGLNRAAEQTELKKLCITMMTGQHFGRFDAVTHPADAPAHHPEIDVDEALVEGPIVQFFEQAFEWEQMTYLFHPYFWGRKQDWVGTLGVDDPDPLFASFLRAGSARVVVPVPVAYVDAVLYLLQSPAPDLADRVWRGGDPPTLDSDLYVSIAQEFQDRTDDLAGATPEGDPWEFTLPTTLVWLQPDGTLPTFV